MNLLPMRYFLQVEKSGSISAAARELLITQQTLSSHIAALEKELGCSLICRRSAGGLTPEGEVFLAYCRKMVALDDHMHREFRERQSEPQGVLKIGISQTRSHLLMPVLAEKWFEIYPCVRLQISEMTNDRLIRGAQDGTCDVSIGNIYGDVPELLVKDLYKEELLLLIPKQEKFRHLFLAAPALPSSEDLSRMPFILQTKTDIVGRLGKHFFERLGIVPRVSAYSDNAETCMEMCAKGVGLYICPDQFIRDGTYQEKFFSIPMGIHYHISAACRKDRQKSRLVSDFITLAEQSKNSKGTEL